MNKKEFKKYKSKTISISLMCYFLILGLLLFSIYDKNINNILFSETFLPKIIQDFLGDDPLFFYIWAIVTIPLLALGFEYFKKRNKYYKSAGIVKKDNKKFQKIAFCFFLFTTIASLVFFIFVIEETFFGKYNFHFSENVFMYSFFGLFANFILVLSAKYL